MSYDPLKITLHNTKCMENHEFKNPYLNLYMQSL